jgi:hypothetical protein
MLAKIAHNVPAVYDVFAARIRALRSKDQGCKNVGEVSRGRRSRPRRTEPRSDRRERSIYSPVMCSGGVPYIYFNQFCIKFIINPLNYCHIIGKYTLKKS